jgi:hypothetical protein
MPYSNMHSPTHLNLALGHDKDAVVHVTRAEQMVAGLELNGFYILQRRTKHTQGDEAATQCMQQSDCGLVQAFHGKRMTP